MLQVKDINVYYDKIHAVKGVSFDVSEGEIVTLIGANGAGKTTILKTISGILQSKTGEIRFMNKNISKMPVHSILGMGLSQVPEGRRIFSRMTIKDNLIMGAYTNTDKDDVRKRLKRFYERFPRLYERRHQLAGTLSGGEQQMLAIARALMSNPKLLVMDEPSMGLSPILVQDIFRIIQEVKEEGTTILLVEQNAQMALCVANRAYVLETGNITLSGKAMDLLGNKKIKDAYLGGE